MIDPRDIIGHGADADPSRRPGIPREQVPRPAPNAIVPAQMQSSVKVFTQGHPGKALPPVYGTAQPPKGVSGLVRAAAYRYPDHWTRHWMMLLLADRIDAVEHRVRTVRGVATMAAVLLIGGVAIGLARPERASRWMRGALRDG